MLLKRVKNLEYVTLWNKRSITWNMGVYTTRKLSDTCHPYRKRLNRCHVWQGEYS